MSELLFLAHRIPYPPDKGDKIRSWNILRYLCARTRVHLAAFVDDPADFAHYDFLAQHCASVKLIPLDRKQRWKRAWSGWSKGEPLSVAIYRDREMSDWVRDVLRQQDVSSVFVYSSQMAPYALPHINARRRVVMDFVDMDSDKWRQYADVSRGLKKMIYAREARTLLHFEKQVARAVDASLFVSDDEASLFRKLAGSYGHAIEAMHNGVDLDYYDPAVVAPLPDARQPCIAFTGAMDYRPNADAVIWFVENVWPLVRAREPEATFYIVGSKPGAAVMKLADTPGVVVTGRVPDVRPYLASAAAVVAPLRLARGIQNKVLEAMAMARPVVATPAAYEGIDAQPGVHLFVEEEPAQQAELICGLFHDTGFGRDMGLRARARMAERYGWEACLSILDQWLPIAAPGIQPQPQPQSLAGMM